MTSGAFTVPPPPGSVMSSTTRSDGGGSSISTGSCAMRVVLLVSLPPSYTSPRGWLPGWTGSVSTKT